MQDIWDSRYQHKDFVFGTEASEFLLELKSQFKPGMRVLALGDGEGRNGVWLAELGTQVTSIDWSKIAQQKAQTLANNKNVNVTFVCKDIMTWDWPREYFDAVVSIFLHVPEDDRKVITNKIFHALKPGGLFIMEAFHRDQITRNGQGPKDPALLMSIEQALNEFSEFETQFCRKVITQVYSSDRPLEDGDAVQYLGLKPER